MKKTLTISMLALAFAFAFTASAAGDTFTKTLKKGSTGAEVTALQTLLASKSLLSASPTGYFGNLTVAAVKAYQTSKGISAVGQVGPATRAALNLEGATVSTGVAGCGAGAMFSSVTGQACTTTTTGGTTATGGIATPGVAGTLPVTLWTTPSGVTAYKGQSADFVGYKLQAAASDMAVTSMSVDFSRRFWLYANTLTVKDETGKVVAQVSNLNASNFTEMAVGTDYRISIPVTGLVVKATQIKYLTVGASFNPVSDRADDTITVSQAQVRSVDGTGVTDTETTAVLTGTQGQFSYKGTNIGNLIITTDTASPVAQVVQVSTAAQTMNVPLAIFDIKSQNQPGTLQTLTVDLSMSSTSGSGVTTFGVGEIFSNLQLTVGGLTYSASAISTTSATFSNMNVPLVADVYTPVKISATLAQNTTNKYNGTVVRVSLTPNTSTVTPNPVIVDATYNNVVPTSNAALNGNYLTFSSAGVSAGSLATVIGNTVSNTSGSSTKDITFNWSLTAGNNPIYISATSTTALTVATSGTPGTLTLYGFRDLDNTGDLANNFYLAPGQTKTFTASVSSVGNPGTVRGTYSITGLNYGTVLTNNVPTSTGSLSAPIIGSSLYASYSY